MALGGVLIVGPGEVVGPGNELVGLRCGKPNERFSEGRVLVQGERVVHHDAIGLAHMRAERALDPIDQAPVFGGHLPRGEGGEVAQDRGVPRVELRDADEWHAGW